MEKIRISHKYEHFNKAIYEMISKDVRVLDIGCSVGTLGHKLIEEKQCEVSGIDIDANALKIARKRGFKVYNIDMNYVEELPFYEKYFDVIIFGDVLEHLNKPENILLLSKKYLKDYGFIVVSLPNIAFIQVRLSLLFGKFEYKEKGILDKTHLRFYTLKTAKRLIENCGYNIVEIEPWSPVKKRYFLIPLLIKAFPTLFAIQFVIKTEKVREI